MDLIFAPIEPRRRPAQHYPIDRTDRWEVDASLTRRGTRRRGYGRAANSAQHRFGRDPYAQLKLDSALMHKTIRIAGLLLGR
jgi:hypothetical protein